MDQKKIIVSDIDEVITESMQKWLYLALHDEHIITRIRNLDVITEYMKGPESFRKYFRLRDEYDLIKWMNLDEIIREHFLDIYRKNGSFYNDLSLTRFGLSLVAMSKSHHIIFVSHSLNGDADSSKRFFIDRNFKGCSYELHLVPYGEKKSDVINSVTSKFDIFIDDNTDNMLSVAENCSPEGSYIMYPVMGYNMDAAAKLQDIVKQKKLNVLVI